MIVISSSFHYPLLWERIDDTINPTFHLFTLFLSFPRFFDPSIYPLAKVISPLSRLHSENNQLKAGFSFHFLSSVSFWMEHPLCIVCTVFGDPLFSLLALVWMEIQTTAWVQSHLWGKLSLRGSYYLIGHEFHFTPEPFPWILNQHICDKIRANEGLIHRCSRCSRQDPILLKCLILIPLDEQTR